MSEVKGRVVIEDVSQILLFICQKFPFQF
jgi:hypothetical protein